MENLNKEKQIEEMACEKCLHHFACLVNSEYVPTPCPAYEDKAGYRKQTEGEWIDEPHFAQRGLKGKYYVCSKCNVCVPTIVELPLNMWHYCPNCGAKMRGGEV